MGFKVASRVRGLSDEAFREAFGTEEQCRAALVRLRWPDGFVCPCCGHREHCVLAGRGLYQCNRCKKQTSPTAGTIFHATKLPLTLWFAAIHLIVTAKNGISSVELGRRLGVKQPTAWAVKHKIMAVMARREGETAACGAGGDGRCLSRRSALRRQAGPRRGGQDALRGGGLDQSLGAPAQAEAGAGQGLPQARDRARRQALAGPRSGGRDGRPGLLERTRRGRLQPSGDPYRVGPTGSPHGIVQMGEHDARQHQERDHRDLSQARPRPCRTLSRQLRLALQPALSTPDNDPAFRP